MQRRPGFPMWTLEQWMEQRTYSQTRRAAGALTASFQTMRMYQTSMSSTQVRYFTFSSDLTGSASCTQDA